MPKCIVIKIGEHPGLKRDYYQDIFTERYYIRQEDESNRFNWYTTDKLWGNPKEKVKNISFYQYVNLEMEL